MFSDMSRCLIKYNTKQKNAITSDFSKCNSIFIYYNLPFRQL